MTCAIYMKGWNLQKQLFKLGHQQMTRMLSVKNNNSLYLSILIERPSCLSPELTTAEKKIMKTLDEIEFENSLKSNYELKKENKTSNKLYEPFQREHFLNHTTEDIEEKSQNELKQLKINPRPADFDSDNASTDIYNSNFLLIKQEESKDVWLPPKDIIHSHESIKEAAKRILNNYFGEKFLVYFYGYAPLGFKQDKVQKKIQKQKVFYILAKYVEGFSNDARHRWLTLSEMEKMIPEAEYKYMSHLILKK